MAFDKAFDLIIGQEGGYGADTRDPGNWTGGKCGLGTCRGTKYGISAASYPMVDIAGLSTSTAKVIYHRDYWAAIRADEMPPALALLVFDAAVNNGVGQAIRWLQAATKVLVDGQLGAQTMAAVAAASGQGPALMAEFQSLRLIFMTGLPAWKTFGHGWARRLCRMPYDANLMEVI